MFDPLRYTVEKGSLWVAQGTLRKDAATGGRGWVTSARGLGTIQNSNRPLFSASLGRARYWIAQSQENWPIAHVLCTPRMVSAVLG